MPEVFVDWVEDAPKRAEALKACPETAVIMKYSHYRRSHIAGMW
jgi:hypothetical protein